MKTIHLLLCLLVLIGLCFTPSVMAQTAHSMLRKGDQEYLEKRFADSESNYRKALERKNSAKGQYNLGNAIYQQKRYQEALTRYQNAVKKAGSPADKAAAYHNLGNTYYQLNDLQKSVSAYKEALRLNPADKETKFNLALAQHRKKEEEQKKQRSSPDDKQNQPQDQKSPSNQGQKPNQDPKEGQKPQQNQGQSQNQEQKSPPPNLSKKEAENLLKIMDEEERKVQGKMKKASGKPKSGKDW